ncbi:MAG: hypothetical protein ACAI34_23495 [Verrucomicrobium sp.]|nr:hypothetical protein [Verrucomicrobium sp.]
MNPSSEPSSPQLPPTGSVPKVNIQGLSTVLPGLPDTGAPVPVAAPAAPVNRGAPVPVVVTAPAGPVILAPLSTAPEKKGNFISTYWRKVGGGSLIISILVHVGILLAAMLMVTTIVERDKAVDFLPGGGSKAGQEASQNMARQVQMKKRSLLNKSTPMTKVVSTSTNAAIALPDMPADNLDVPELSSLMGGGTMGSSGFGSSGAGGGFGDGMGMGGASGATFKPIIMFGQDLKARKIAVIMDVSGSMTPHLTKVVKELDRVASGSKVVLYVGCGVASPANGKRLDDDAMPTRTSTKVEERSFESFWRKSHQKQPTPGMPAPPPKKKDEPDPVPEQAVYDVLANRGETYFIKSQGIEYAWISLLVREVRDADALYWFSDFQDKVDDEQLEAVLKNLKRRKQKLFIHASGEGRSFADVRDKLCIPSGGEVVKDPNKK